MIQRHLKIIIEKYLFQKKSIILFGARQTGKTTLMEEVLKPYRNETLFLNGDDADARNMLSDLNAAKLTPIIGKAKIVFIDEAQRIPEAGLALKIIHDNYKSIQLIATGSSSFDLAGKIKEPLTGRKFEFNLYPLSFSEMADHHGFLKEKRLIEHRLIYGYYPDIVVNAGMEKKLITSLASSFLYKDLLMLDSIKKPVLLEKILSALALQAGNEVSYNELAQLLSSDKETIEKYIDLLEKTGVIFRLGALNRNVRNEIKRGRKIYFLDNGIRNAVLGNFSPIPGRTDVGALWENFLISERLKYLQNTETDAKSWFWRTTQQQEVDYIEEREGRLFAFEFKWNPHKNSRLSKTFSNAYKKHEFRVITTDNFHEFVRNN